MRSIRWIKVKLQETIKPNISNKSNNILGVDRVEQFMQRRNVEVSQHYHTLPCVVVFVMLMLLIQQSSDWMAVMVKHRLCCKDTMNVLKELIVCGILTIEFIL